MVIAHLGLVAHGEAGSGEGEANQTNTDNHEHVFHFVSYRNYKRQPLYAQI